MTHHFEVFYIDRSNGWAVAEYDADDNQISEAEYCYLKSDAIKNARAQAGGIYPIYVFGRDGENLKTLNSAKIEVTE